MPVEEINRKELEPRTQDIEVVKALIRNARLKTREISTKDIEYIQGKSPK